VRVILQGRDCVDGTIRRTVEAGHTVAR
jgi:hypothetical protein